MSIEPILLVGRMVAVGVAALAVYDLVRRRTLGTIEVALYFIAFGLVSFVSFDIPLAWFTAITLGAVSMPYLLIRLADHFRPVPRIVHALAVAGLLYSWALNVWLLVVVFRGEGTAGSQPTPEPLLALVMSVYLVGGTGYATWAFLRSAVGTGGALVWRARLAAVGSLLVAFAIAEMTAATLVNRTETGLPRPPAPALDAFAALLALAALAYFAGFASPPWLRQMWRLAELHRFLQATAEMSIGERGRESLQALVDATKRATGASSAAVSTDERAPLSAYRIAVPIGTAGRRFGTLVATFRRGPLFPRDDAAIMSLMAGQTAIALANDELLRERRELDERERVRLRSEMARVEQELEVARRIQLSLLPRATPSPAGWSITSYYRPAREVGGDLYDFFTLPDGSLAIVIGDASGHGMAAALVMATARSEVRSAGATTSSPGAILARANASLVDGMPPSTFVTCMVVALDTGTGRARYANAGHDLAYGAQEGRARELRARGMPLGLMAEQVYEEMETTIAPAETVLLYTDGIVEAHAPDGRSMFSFGRLRDLVARANGDPTALVMTELAAFTGPAWEQEDDITMVSIRRAAS
ncbi:MAG: PP2C family protein-serine/threonine phosphatase [Chloroflexi bacterium]|nr:PP2C family protein-serine/threonine phosphatase [Chloroflexota bacterium]